MTDQRFDLSYRGLIALGADPAETRRRLSQIFRLTEQGADRLFTGQAVIVKRNVDAATATRFEGIFAKAGAVLTLTPVASPGPKAAAVDALTGDSARRAGVSPQVAATGWTQATLALAPQGGDLEANPDLRWPDLNTSYLSLVQGGDWTLLDCAAPATPIPEPDISDLSLAPDGAAPIARPIP